MTWLNHIHVGDCRALMREMAAAGVRVNCVVTSPPYFGLRDYGHAEQIGLEAEPAAYVETMRTVFEMARQVLADDGTLWLNLGDSYAGSGRGGDTGASGLEGSTGSQDASKAGRAAQRGSQLAAGLHESQRQAGAIARAWVAPPKGYRQKNLIGIPWRVAFALQDVGWNLRQDIIWSKPNPMPESVTDRCTKAHEYLFLLSRSKRYYFNAAAIQERVAESTVARLQQPTLDEQQGSDRVPGKTNGNMKAVGATDVRNARSVWTIPTNGFPGAHFATFPRELVRRCILAGSRPCDTVFDPFMGSGTVAEVALDLGRNFIGCELNPEYAAMFKTHRSQQVGLGV